MGWTKLEFSGSECPQKYLINKIRLIIRIRLLYSIPITSKYEASPDVLVVSINGQSLSGARIASPEYDPPNRRTPWSVGERVLMDTPNNPS